MQPKFARLTGLALLALSAPSLAAQAGDAYFGAGYSLINYAPDGGDDAKPGIGLARLGYFVTPNIAIEGRFGLGLNDDDTQIGNTTATVEVDQVAGAYGVAHIPVSRGISLYGLAGFSTGEITVSARNASAEVSDTDFSYGVGTEVAFTQRVNGFAEWAQYFDESGYSVSGLTLGLNYPF